MSRVEEVLHGAVAGEAVPGIVAIVGDADGIVREVAAGTLGPDDDRPAGGDTVFRIASMTKAMTSVAALQLIERGSLALEAPVADVLPGFGELQVLDGFDAGGAPRLRAPARPATLRHLLTHTSGLGYWFSEPDLLRWHEATGAPTVLTGRRAGIETPLLHDPGERFTYGVSTDWVGQVVEAVSGQSLEDYLREHVWEPLGMRDTTFYPTAEQRSRLMDLVSRTPDGGLGPGAFAEPETEFASGGGGSFSTPRDYARFQRMLLRGGELDGARVLEPATVELLFTDQLDGAPLPELTRSAVPELTLEVPGLPFEQGWGLGLHLLLQDIPGMRRAGSADWAGLFNCYFWIDRKSGVTAALMTQLLPFFDRRVFETLLGFESALYAELGASAVR